MEARNLLNPAPTKAQILAAMKMAMAVAEAISELGEVPSGQLYAQLCCKIDLPTYERIIETIKGAGLVEERAHLLRWIGPELQGVGQ